MTKRGKMNGGSLHLILMCGQVFYVMLGDREFRNPLFKHLSLPRVGEIRQDKQFLNLTLNIAWKFPHFNVSIFAALLVLPRQSELVSRGHSQLLFGSKFIWGQCQMFWCSGQGWGQLRQFITCWCLLRAVRAGDRGQARANKSSRPRHLGRDIRCRKKKTLRVWWNFDSAPVWSSRSNRVLNHFYPS